MKRFICNERQQHELYNKDMGPESPSQSQGHAECQLDEQYLQLWDHKLADAENSTLPS